MMKVLDLFSGIGGFSLGLERTGGYRTVAFCEIEPYCRKVLAKHWPDVRCYDDVTTLTAARLAADGIAEAVGNAAGAGSFPAAQAGIYRSEESAGSWHAQPQRRGIDVICGGFPCQDISLAGKGAGIGGDRSGLWSEFARLIGELRPGYVFVENVSALLGRGLDRVLGDLAALGYDAEWHCIPAAAVGAPHRRDRIWIVAYPSQTRPHLGNLFSGVDGKTECSDSGEAIELGSPARGWENVADAACELLNGTGTAGTGRRRQSADGSASVADADRRPLFGAAIAWPERHPWQFEPDVGRVAHGIPHRVDRLKDLGNAVVPQIPELIGRAILIRVRIGA